MAAFKRAGLHRLDCQGCDNYTYSTVAAIETHGLPQCKCGGEFQPAKVELALELGMTELPIAAAYFAKVSSVMHGQEPSLASLKLAARRAAKGTELETPEMVALAEFRKSESARARKRRLAALLPAPQPMAF